jgi:DNA-binding transcriptional regulator YhcF (GntR family)
VSLPRALAVQEAAGHTGQVPDTPLDIALDLTSSVPPFEQLRSQIAAQVADGALVRGTRLPTVRQLATELGLAANTVARSYRELEADGVLVTQGRRGTFVHTDARPEQEQREVAQHAAAYATAARRAGLSLPEAARLVEEAWRAG